MKEECLICKAPLEYLEVDELMECAICLKKRIARLVVLKVIMSVTTVTLQDWIQLLGFVLMRHRKTLSISSNR